MTDIDNAFSGEHATSSPEQPATRTTRRLWIAAGATGGTILLGLGWLVLYAAPEARNAIEVEPRWLRCAGESMPYEIANADDDDTSDPRPQFVIRLNEANYERCQMKFTIINTGSRTVHIDKVEFPGMAPAELGGVLEVAENLSDFVPQDPAIDDDSAYIDVNSDLEGNSSFDELVDLRPRPSAVSRMGSGVTAGRINLPRIHLSYLGVPMKSVGRITITVEK